MEEGCGFLQPKRMHTKSQTLPDLPRRLEPPRQRAARRGSRIRPDIGGHIIKYTKKKQNTAETISPKNTH